MLDTLRHRNMYCLLAAQSLRILRHPGLGWSVLLNCPGPFLRRYAHKLRSNGLLVQVRLKRGSSSRVLRGATAWETRRLPKIGYVLNLRRHVVLCHSPCKVSSSLLREPQLGTQDAAKTGYVLNLRRHVVLCHLPCNMSTGATDWKTGC